MKTKLVRMTIEIMVNVPDNVDESSLHLGNECRDFLVQSAMKPVEHQIVSFTTIDAAVATLDDIMN